MKTIVVHYYDGAFATTPVTNKTQPIILAISAARNQNPHADIVVFENSVLKQDWGKFPDLLRFEVRPAQELDIFNFGHPLCNTRGMGKLWDVADTSFRFPLVSIYPNNYIPIHRDQEYLYMDRLYLGSEGCYALNRNSERAMFSLNGWQGLCLLFAQSREFRNRIIRFTKGQIVTEYTLAQYISSNNLYQTHCLNPLDFMPLSELLEAKPACGGVLLNSDFCGSDLVKVIAAFKELKAAVNWELMMELHPDFKQVPSNNFSIADLWEQYQLVHIQDWFGKGFRRKSDQFWIPARNNDWRYFNEQNSFII
jgi:hypothetical protein